MGVRIAAKRRVRAEKARVGQQVVPGVLAVRAHDGLLEQIEDDAFHGSLPLSVRRPRGGSDCTPADHGREGSSD